MENEKRIIMGGKLSIHWVENGAKQVKLALGEVCSCICTIYYNGKARIMMVDNVETLEKYRGQGYGQKLIEEAIAFAKTQNVDSIELVVNQDNAPAIRLYEKTGFKRIDKFFYRLILNVWQT